MGPFRFDATARTGVFEERLNIFNNPGLAEINYNNHG